MGEKETDANNRKTVAVDTEEDQVVGADVRLTKGWGGRGVGVEAWRGEVVPSRVELAKHGARL